MLCLQSCVLQAVAHLLVDPCHSLPCFFAHGFEKLEGFAYSAVHLGVFGFGGLGSHVDGFCFGFFLAVFGSAMSTGWFFEIDEGIEVAELRTQLYDGVDFVEVEVLCDSSKLTGSWYLLLA